MTFFTTVENVLKVSGRGAVLALPENWGRDVRIRVGDKIQLRTPDGQVFDTQITGIELLKRAVGPCVAGIICSREISAALIPTNTEIWLAEPQA